jgi:hypothetical protein
MNERDSKWLDEAADAIETVIPPGYDRLSEPITIYWYEHDCEWVTKFCDEHHRHHAQVVRVVLEAIIQQTTTSEFRPKGYGRMKIEKEDADFIGAVLGAQIGATHAVMNRISDAGWRTAVEWAERYRELKEELYEANDSIRVLRVLNSHVSAANDITLDHYRKMAHGETVVTE